MSAKISRLRKRYKPKVVKLLFVAESPPESTDKEVRFFYNPRQEQWDYMYRAVMEGVFPDFKYSRGEKDKWLRKFKQHGYYMIDATDNPVNRLSAKKRRRMLDDAMEKKLAKITKLVSPNTPIVLVKKNVFAAFAAPLRHAGYKVAHKSFLPFPAYGHQKRFIKACRKCLSKHQPVH